MPKRHTNFIVRLFSHNHYCSTPTAFKALRCVVKGATGRGRERTYYDVCKDSSLVTLVEPVDKHQRVNAANQERLDARKEAQQSTLGVVLEHSSPNSRARAMFCDPVHKDAAHALTVAERAEAIKSLPDDVLASQVYNNNDAPLRNGQASGFPDLSTVYDLFLGPNFAQTAPAIAHKAADAVAACKAATARRADLTCASGVTQAKPAKGCRDLHAPVSISGISETATIACVGGVVTATVVTHGSVVQSMPCHLAATEIALTPAWADAAVTLALAHGARSAGEVVPDVEWQAQRLALEKLTLASHGIPHALRPFAWGYLLRDKMVWPESGLHVNPDKLPLDVYMNSLAESALEKCAEKIKSVQDKPPCQGVSGIDKDASRIADNVFARGNPFATESVRFRTHCVRRRLSPSVAGTLCCDSPQPPPSFFFDPRYGRQVHNGKITRGEVLKRDFIDAIVDTATDAGDKARLKAFFTVNLALEDLFAPEHEGDKPRRAYKEEYQQNFGVYPIFALAASLPAEVSFLARAHMLAEFTPAGADSAYDCQLHAAPLVPPPAHTVARILYTAHKTRPLQRNAFDVANVASDQYFGAQVLGSLNDVKYDDSQMCFHLNQRMMDVLWYATDAEPAYRILDLQFVLPPKRAKLVAEAAMAAFADVFEAHLRSLKPRPAEELESYACGIIGANVKQGTIVVTDLFSPADVGGWFDTMLKLLAELESRGGPRSAKGEPSFLLATRRH